MDRLIQIVNSGPLDETIFHDVQLWDHDTVLRIAAMWGHSSVVLGAFGVGHIFRNPAREVARMWKQLLFHEEEFSGVFANVVFAIQTNQPGNGRAGSTEHEVFQEEFDPSKIFESKYVKK